MGSRFLTGAAGVAALLTLVGGVVVRGLGLPNQLALTATGFVLLSLVYLPARFLGHRAHGTFEGWRRSTGLAATATLPLALGAGAVSVEGASVVVVVGAVLALLGYTIWASGTTSRRRVGPRLAGREWALYGVSIACLVLSVPAPAIIDDPRYHPSLGTPAHPPGAGPLVLVDEGHGNASTLAGSYGVVGRALAEDGYRVRPIAEPLDAERLGDARILMVVNALNREAIGARSAAPMSAFSAEEIAAVSQWVSSGGALFLIADHRPYAGAAADLAAEVGFTFLDGFADDEAGREDRFDRASGTIRPSPVADGRHPSERVNEVRTFVGQAISLPADATPVLVLSPGYRLWPSLESWRARRAEDGISVAGCAQFAVRTHGRGRVAVAGDSGVFTARLEHGLSWRPIGMNAPGGADNHRLLLNTVHWLDGLLP